MNQPEVSLLLSAYRTEPYMKKFYDNVMELLEVARLQLVHIMNDPSEAELGFRDQFEELARSVDAFCYKHEVVPRESVAASYNRAVRLSDYNLVSISNVDDLRYPEGLLRQLESFANCPELLLQGANVNVRTENSLISGDYAEVLSQKDYNSGMHLGPFFIWNKSLVSPVNFGIFDEQFKVAGDFDFQIRVSQLGITEVLSQSVGEYLNIGAGLSTSSVLQAIESQVIYRRYNVVDKILPLTRLLIKRLGYRVNSIAVEGEWQDIETLVPGLEAIRKMNGRRKITNIDRFKGLIRAIKLNVKAMAYVK